MTPHQVVHWGADVLLRVGELSCALDGVDNKKPFTGTSLIPVGAFQVSYRILPILLDKVGEGRRLVYVGSRKESIQRPRSSWRARSLGG